MSQSQFSFAWDSYRTNICGGLSHLQQNEEFVDMTIAADGHFVKVHQVLIALSSSYLKNLISSAPCQHPVVFLNNISHKVLCYLLEYIYTGEVVVPSESLLPFTEAARALHIKGLENVCGDENQLSMGRSNEVYISDMRENSLATGVKRKPAVDMEQISLPLTARKVYIKSEGAHTAASQRLDTTNDSHDFSADMDEPDTQHSDDEIKDFNNQIGTAVDMEQVKTHGSNLLYTVSIRGSLQAILNRYIYNLNSRPTREGVRRWRCVDYRNNKCNAFLVTKGNIVINRAHLHNHPFHDKKILSKIEKKAVFSALDDIEAYREKEKTLDAEGAIDETDLKNQSSAPLVDNEQIL